MYARGQINRQLNFGKDLLELRDCLCIALGIGQINQVK